MAIAAEAPAPERVGIRCRGWRLLHRWALEAAIPFVAELRFPMVREHWRCERCGKESTTFRPAPQTDSRAA